MKMFLCVSMMAFLLAMPDIGEHAAADALAVWGLDVVPSLFPYMVLCQSLAELTSNKKSLRPAAFLLGLLGGSPSASASLNSLCQAAPLSNRLTLFLVSCAGTISPAFYLGPVAKWFSSDRFAHYLLLSQYLGALLAGGLFFLCPPANAEGDRKHSLDQYSPQNPIARSTNAVLNVGGCIVFYSTAAAYINAVLPFRIQGMSECLHALLEISGGMRAFAASGMNNPLNYVLAAGLCGFGGVSILSQNLLFLKPLGLSMKEVSLVAVFRGLFASLSMALLMIM